MLAKYSKYIIDPTTLFHGKTAMRKADKAYKT